jgi:hypothetical protein
VNNNKLLVFCRIGSFSARDLCDRMTGCRPVEILVFAGVVSCLQLSQARSCCVGKPEGTVRSVATFITICRMTLLVLIRVRRHVISRIAPPRWKFRPALPPAIVRATGTTLRQGRLGRVVSCLDGILSSLGVLACRSVRLDSRTALTRRA